MRLTTTAYDVVKFEPTGPQKVSGGVMSHQTQPGIVELPDGSRHRATHDVTAFGPMAGDIHYTVERIPAPTPNLLTAAAATGWNVSEPTLTAPIEKVGVFQAAALSDEVPKLLNEAAAHPERSALLLAQAEKCARAAIDEQPFEPNHVNRLGVVLKRLGPEHLPDAVSAWMLSNELSAKYNSPASPSGFPPANYNLAAIEALKGNAGSAVELLKWAQRGADEQAERARARGDKDVVHNPHFFRELAQRDHDFDAIRGSAEFQAFAG